MRVDTNQTTIQKILTRGVEEVIKHDHLAAALESGKKLRVKLGIDPTTPDIHLGHTVALRKMRQFQDAGHQIILIIGDFTATVGDPSERTEGRKPLSEKEVRANMKTYLTATEKVIDIRKTEVRYNSEWHKHEGLASILELTRASSYQQVIKRSDFRKRLEEGNDITLVEILYPLLQGYDSVKVKADVELGGTDQKFNLLMGRRVQRHFKQPEQDIMTLPILEGTDGIRKMSKSYNNYIAINDAPKNMFGKIMTIPDSLIEKYFTLLTDRNSPSRNDPYAAKILLAETLVAECHNEKLAKTAKENFHATFSKKEMPEEWEELIVTGLPSTIHTLRQAGVPSNSEAMRLLSQGAVEVDGEIIKDPKEERKPGEKIQIGKKKFFRIK